MNKAICIFLLFFITRSSLAAQEKISLNSDGTIADWKLTPQSAVGSDSMQLFNESYSTNNWVKALVPGAVFTAYVEAGIEKDPNWGDNIYQVDKKKYDRNFWYRTTFTVPQKTDGTLWLNFEGINRRGTVYLNGTLLGRLNGFMQHGKYDITHLYRPGKKNILAVLVEWPGRPVANYAMPAYMSSDSWDWMPSVPGLLQGITDDVYLTTSGDVTIEEPWVRTDVSEDRKDAYLHLRFDLKNNGEQEQEGTAVATIQPGNITISKPVKIAPGKSAQLVFDTAFYKELHIKQPLLWWPNGYGDPNLYSLTLSFKTAKENKVSDSKTLQFGIKKYTYDTLGGVLHININGERIFVKGGNWGMSEYLLRCRGAEYDLKVRLHREMNFNMIRNWIGSITDEEFYDACDKYGIMVWDDFWLNSHPNLPDDVFNFNENAVAKIKRLRNHPSIALWCGDNESYPLPPLDGWLREDVKTFDAGDRKYHPNSHSDQLTGSGPWANFKPSWYFTKYPGGFGGNVGWGLRTEIGTAVFTTFESFKKFMPRENWWPRNKMWDLHYFGPQAANAGPDRYENAINNNYGTATGIEDWCRKAQLLNMETNKALFEGWQHHMWNDASGVLTWMSQSAYPSFVWQTYDYYYDLNGAYWGVKEACEPVHIQWSYADNSVKVSNTTLKAFSNMTAEAIVYDINGKRFDPYCMKDKINVKANAATDCFRLNFNTNDLAYQKKAYASTTTQDADNADAVADGNSGSRWASDYTDEQWIYIDLEQPTAFDEVVLNWEDAYATQYRLQVSDDAASWKDIYEQQNGKGGRELIKIAPVTARYVRMKGLHRATKWGYSLYDFEVYRNAAKNRKISTTHFIRLLLKDEHGKLVSDNFYWRSSKSNDYTQLNELPPAVVKTTSSVKNKEGHSLITVTVKNTGHSIAFATKVQACRTSDGERILPAIMNDNYFTLFPGESKEITIDFETRLLNGGGYKVVTEPYNQKKSGPQDL